MSSPCRPSTNTKLKQRHDTTTQSSQENSTKETSYSSEQLGQSHGASWSQSGRVLSSSRRRRPPVRTGSQRHPARTWSILGTLIISANFLFDSSGPACPCNSQNNFISARTLFLPGGEVFNEAEPCNIHAKNPPQKSTSKKTASTVFGIRPTQIHREGQR